MLFKKRKEAKAKELEKAHTQMEQGFDAAIKKVERIEDPAGKALALDNICNAILNQIDKEGAAISEKAKNSQENIDTGRTVVGIGGLVTACFVAGPIGWAALGVGAASIVGGRFVSSQRRKSLAKKLAEASDGHTKRLYVLADHASALAEATVEENVEAISKSPLYKQILAADGLAETFAEAAAKHIATPKAPEAEAAPKRLRLIKRDNKL